LKTHEIQIPLEMMTKKTKPKPKPKPKTTMIVAAAVLEGRRIDDPTGGYQAAEDSYCSY
jgi:hypothetical protein